jgi:pyruvate/2-oxoglutarate dehydrogenase complex dihydrolipoamide dehydrogenase (E3) component
MLSTKNRVSSSCADDLRATISGEVALPGDELYEKGRRVWNGAVRRRAAPRPAAVGARGRAQTTGDNQGFMKALIGERDDRILGFTMIGPEAGEVMAVAQMAMLAGFPYTLPRDAVLTHPTMAEGLRFLFSNVPGRS